MRNIQSNIVYKISPILIKHNNVREVVWTRARCCSHFSRVVSLHCQWPRSLQSWHLLKCRAANAEAIQYIHNPKLACKGFRKNASHPNTTAPQSLFMLRQTARPRPLTAVAVANDIMLLLIWMRSNVQSVPMYRPTSEECGDQGNGCEWVSQSPHTGHTCLVWRHSVPCLLESARCRYKIVPTRQF